MTQQTKLEDFGTHERFQVNEKQIYHRTVEHGNITWIPQFKTPEAKETAILDGTALDIYFSSSAFQAWFIQRQITRFLPMSKNQEPTVETLYQAHLKPRTSSQHPSSLTISNFA